MVSLHGTPRDEPAWQQVKERPGNGVRVLVRVVGVDSNNGRLGQSRCGIDGPEPGTGGGATVPDVFPIVPVRTTATGRYEFRPHDRRVSNLT